jgi:hypothetical protein
VKSQPEAECTCPLEMGAFSPCKLWAAPISGELHDSCSRHRTHWTAHRGARNEKTNACFLNVVQDFKYTKLAPKLTALKGSVFPIPWLGGSKAKSHMLSTTLYTRCMACCYGMATTQQGAVLLLCLCSSSS